MATDKPLRLFHPVLARWFADRLGIPTEPQALAWPRIATGEHVLVVAPTGSGKTLTAFFWALDRLLTGAWPGECTRVLYVSPLKALASDIQRNLLTPLSELTALLASAGVEAPAVRALVRTGDTPAQERQRMSRRPPEILITTPESLNLLLTSGRGRATLTSLACVILDEIHAVIGSKRGVHLATAIERVVALSGEVQRIGLSATIRPVERAATWLGGWAREAGNSHIARPVAVVAARAAKRYHLTVDYPAAGADPDEPDDGLWRRVVARTRATLSGNRSTLIFANSRRMVEKLTRLINEDSPALPVYSHHGSLAREVRGVVEERLRSGELRGVVATSSLELGIDIGHLDEVLLVQTPPTVASAAQRIGRAGHRVGEASRAVFLPLVGRDLLDAAVMTRAILDGAIEETWPVQCPLDVLAQVVLSMTATETWPIGQLLAAVRSTDAFHALTGAQLDLVLDMLAGRWATLRVRELRPLVVIDRVAGTVRGLPGADRLVYRSGGTIPDRGYFHLRRSDSMALLGELDEEFVWERSIGDTFSFGLQSWRIERVTHNDVLVSPSRSRAAMAPFWRAEERSRSFALSERIGAFLESAEGVVDDATFGQELMARHCLSAAASAALVEFLSRQKSHTGGKLPHRHRLLVERVVDPTGQDGGEQLILHTLWGSRVNRPIALVLAAAWQRRHAAPLEVIHDNDCLVVNGPRGIDVGELLDLLTGGDLETTLRSALSGSGLFGARFREAAGCALVLPRGGPGRRMPLWLGRQRAKELLAGVSSYPDFPLVLEAWRACLQEEFDLRGVACVLDDLTAGRIVVSEVATSTPSPFAANATWKRTNTLMYEDDTPVGTPASLADGDLRRLVLGGAVRRLLAPNVVETFRRKLQRTHPGWTPRSSQELTGWLAERAMLPTGEWEELITAIGRDHSLDLDQVRLAVASRVVVVVGSRVAGSGLVVEVEAVGRVVAALAAAGGQPDLRGLEPTSQPAPEAAAALARAAAVGAALEYDLAELIAELLRFQGPVKPAWLAAVLALEEGVVEAALQQLADEQRVVIDEMIEGSGGSDVADAENLERLLRISRATSRPSLVPRPAEHLPLFLARWQRLGLAGGGIDDLQRALEPLLGFAAPAALWETEILPARLDPYFPGWLDTMLGGGELRWVGCAGKRLAFTLESERELLADEDEEPPDTTELDALFPHPSGRFPLAELALHSGLSSGALTRRLWHLVWSGLVGCDGFAALRTGLASGFAPSAPTAATPSRLPSRRVARGRWQASRPFAGAWYRMARVRSALDPLEREELAKDRARVLVERYGVVFRELAERELPPLTWGRVARALRLMELGGEVVSGQFFTGPAGLQFASPAMVRLLEEGVPEDRVVWMNACDPASPAGLGFGGRWPRRVATSHLVMHGSRLVVRAQRRARNLSIAVPPEHPRASEYLGFLKVLATRQVSPQRALVVDEINGVEAASSLYREILSSMFDTVRDGTSLRLLRRYAR